MLAEVARVLRPGGTTTEADPDRVLARSVDPADPGTRPLRPMRPLPGGAAVPEVDRPRSQQSPERPVDLPGTVAGGR